MRTEKYRLSFLLGGLMAPEAAIAAPLYLELGSWDVVRQKLKDENLLHARTETSAVRLGNELIPRMRTLSDAEIRHIATAPSSDRRYLMWVALCRQFTMVAEFAEEVLRDNWLLGVKIGYPDFDRFWIGKALWHQELDEIKPSTKQRLRYNLFLAMRQAEFLSVDGTIVSPLLSSELIGMLNSRQPSETRFFPIQGGMS